jgi:hypothetical protein
MPGVYHYEAPIYHYEAGIIYYHYEAPIRSLHVMFIHFLAVAIWYTINVHNLLYQIDVSYSVNKLSINIASPDTKFTFHAYVAI